LFLALVWDTAQFLRSHRPAPPRGGAGRRHRDAPHPRQACAPGWLRKGRWGWGRTFRPRASPSRPRRRPHCM